MQHNKPPKRRIHGVLLLDKHTGISSNGALQQAKRLYRAEKAGHTGVLDPLANGLLPVCFGEAAKFAQYLLDADKAYTATLKLGEATTTGDAEGEIIARGNADISLSAFQAACSAFTGKIRQVPPMFSALKHAGKPLYEYARQGITLERKARDIEIYRIRIAHFQPPVAVIEVECSKGTYIRTLAEDIAKHLNTVAHLTALRRTRTAGFSVDNGYTPARLNELSETERDALLLPCDALVQHFPQTVLSESDIRKLQFGQNVTIISGSLPEHEPIRIYAADGVFIGLAQYLHRQHILKAVRLMSSRPAAN